jgi:hypothetical protein
MYYIFSHQIELMRELLLMKERNCGFREHHKRSVGVLWAFGGFLQTRFYNNAAKIFSAIIKIWTLYQYMPKRSARVARDMLFGRFLEGS